jgi:methyl-CpG-binding domain protein 4
MIEIAQDAENILDAIEDDGHADALETVKGFEDEESAPESTWEGCESDDDSDAGPPSTSKREIKVVIYTPSKTWVPVDTKATCQPSPSFEDAIQDTNDDNTSIFSMSRNGSLDFDHSGDELDKIQFAAKRKRSSTASPENQSTVPVEIHALDPVTPRNKRGSISSTSTSEKKTISVVRDSKGRFAPKNSSLVKDSHGRFAPKGTPANTPAKRRASSGASTLEKAPHSLERDSKGRFAPKKETPIPLPKPLARRRASTSVIPDDRSFVLTRDAKGKFALKQTPLPLVQTSNSPENSGNLPPRAVVDDIRQPNLRSRSNPAKAKKAPAKSPYFIPPTPPISPELTRKSKGQKGERAKPLNARTTPQKNNEDSPASQGSGKKRPPAKMISCIPFPPLSAPHFGLIQEKLAHDPFRLLIAVTFLIRTHGKHAIPVFFDLMQKYPTPESLVVAEKEEIVPIIRHLGLQNQRAGTYQTYANIWLENPPVKGKRYAVRGYPNPDSGRDVRKGEILDDEDERDAWEIGHMTQGPYAIDSWRIFCRDKLRGEAEGWNGEGRGEGFQPEWMRVLPEDKELRAYLRWMWLKEGFEWDPFTGDKEVARPELMRAAMEGRIVWDDQGGMQILDEVMSASPTKSDSNAEKSQVSTPRVRDNEDTEDELAK